MTNPLPDPSPKSSRMEVIRDWLLIHRRAIARTLLVAGSVGTTAALVVKARQSASLAEKAELELMESATDHKQEFIDACLEVGVPVAEATNGEVFFDVDFKKIKPEFILPKPVVPND